MDEFIAGKYWPTRNDYDYAMEEISEHMLDPDLREGVLERQRRTNMLVHRGRDAYTCLYHIDEWMLRCFCHSEFQEQGTRADVLERYKKLEHFYQKNQTRVSALVPIYYVERGIRVDFFKYDRYSNEIREYIKTADVPFVKMSFIRAIALNSFITYNLQDNQRMHQLSDAWLHMIEEMEAIPMAHGDLDLTNVLVQESPAGTGLVLKLIDYDNTWIPEFASYHYPLPEQGHEFFQHPSFFGKSRTFDETIDRFAALVIYISLRVLADFPEMYQKWNLNDNRLIFSPSDYQAEQRDKSERISLVRGMRIANLSPYLDELSACLRQKRMPRSLTSIGEKSLELNNVAEPDEEQGELQAFPVFEIRITDWDKAEYSPRENSLRAQRQTAHSAQPSYQAQEEVRFPQITPQDERPQDEPPSRYRRIEERRQKKEPLPPVAPVQPQISQFSPNQRVPQPESPAAFPGSQIDQPLPGQPVAPLPIQRQPDERFPVQPHVPQVDNPLPVRQQPDERFPVQPHVPHVDDPTPVQQEDTTDRLPRPPRVPQPDAPMPVQQQQVIPLHQPEPLTPQPGNVPFFQQTPAQAQPGWTTTPQPTNWSQQATEHVQPEWPMPPAPWLQQTMPGNPPDQTPLSNNPWAALEQQRLILPGTPPSYSTNPHPIEHAQNARPNKHRTALIGSLIVFVILALLIILLVLVISGAHIANEPLPDLAFRLLQGGHNVG